MPLEAEMTVKLDVEPTAQGKVIIKNIVVEVLQELFVETPWLEERVNQLVGQAFERRLARIKAENARMRTH